MKGATAHTIVLDDPWPALFSPPEPLLKRSLQRMSGRPVYVLMEYLTYVSGDGWSCVIKPGAVTDWASVPRLLTWLVPVDDKAGLAALLHDELCARAGEGLNTRLFADQRFKIALRELGVPAWRAELMYQAVRLNARSQGLK